MPTVKETFDLMPTKFKAASAAGVNKTIQYDISGDGGGTWHAVIKDGTCTVNSGPATMSYVDQMLERSFPLRAFYDGGRLLMRAITPFRAGDTVTFAGEVTDKRVEDGNRIVECRVSGANQRGELVCLSEATMMLPS